MNLGRRRELKMGLGTKKGEPNRGGADTGAGCGPPGGGAGRGRGLEQKRLSTASCMSLKVEKWGAQGR